MVAVVLFGILGIGMFVMGGLVLASAPAVTQEMAGLLMVLCGVVALGFGAVLSTLNQIREEQRR